MRLAALLIASLALAGCRNATWLPNGDAALNKPAAEFAKDAAGRFPYPSDLPRGGDFRARAEIGYDRNVVNLANFSGAPLGDVEVWVNHAYVVALPSVPTDRAIVIPFKVLYNDRSEHFPENGTTVDAVGLKVNGTLYNVPTQLGG